MVSKSILITAAAMTAGVALAGCGGSSKPAAAGSQSASASHASSSASPSSSASTSASASAASTTPQAHVGQKVSGAALTARLRAADEKSGSADMTEQTNSNGRTATVSGVVRYKNGQISEALTETVAGVQLHIVYLNNVMYVEVPGQTPPWSKITASGTDPLSKELSPLLQELSQAGSGPAPDPQQVWTVSSVGPQGTSYVTQVSAAQLKASEVKLYGAGAAAKLPAPTALQVTETLDSQGRIAKIVTARAGQTISTSTYSNWGTKAPVTAPPANEVGTFGNSAV